MYRLRRIVCVSTVYISGTVYDCFISVLFSVMPPDDRILYLTSAATIRQHLEVRIKGMHVRKE
jgi:hypothetical protein